MKENEIRPEALLQRYLELSELDVAKCFGVEARTSIPCVACAGTAVKQDFVKNGFAFGLCDSCGTLYQTPRPPPSTFDVFYRNSESSNFWADVFFPAVAEVRREKIFKPRVNRLIALCEKKSTNIQRVIDVGAGFGIFLEEWRKRVPATQLIAIEPSNSLAAECRLKGFEVVEDIVERVGGEYENFADLVVCFEVLEHVYEPLAFVKSLMRLVRPGGLVFVSTLCIDGFDLQTLWDRSNQISPPHHINFLSKRGFKILFERSGLQDVSITTPGELDVDIVLNAVVKDRDLLKVHRFIGGLIGNETVAVAFQKFLSESGLSSHAWVIGKKPS